MKLVTKVFKVIFLGYLGSIVALSFLFFPLNAQAQSGVKTKAIHLSPSSPADAKVGQNYNVPIIATSGTRAQNQGNFEFILEGTLPEGINGEQINAYTYLLSGTPTKATNTVQFFLQVKDLNSQNPSERHLLSMKVVGASGGGSGGGTTTPSGNNINPAGSNGSSSGNSGSSGSSSGSTTDAKGFIQCGNGTVQDGKISDACTIGDLFKTAIYITNFLIAFAGLIAVGAIVFGGFSMVVSAGNTTGLTAARKRLTNGIIGFVIVMIAFLLVNTLLNGPLNIGVRDGTSIFKDPLKYIKGK